MISVEKLLRIISGGADAVVQWLVVLRGISFQATTVTLVDGATITPNGATGQDFYFQAASNGVRAIQLPTNIAAGATFWLTLSNASGGALTNTTFVGTYKGTPTLPADTKQRASKWRWDGTNAFLMVETGADTPN